MENSTIDNSYLHKKFKKQLNIVVESNNKHQNENKSGIVESCKEKTMTIAPVTTTTTTCNSHKVENVPKQSTNQKDNSFLFKNINNNNMSSISTENSSETKPTTTTNHHQQLLLESTSAVATLQSCSSSSNPTTCISYEVVKPNSNTVRHNNSENISFPNFDKQQQYSKIMQPTLSSISSTSTTTSSILGNLYIVNNSNKSTSKPPQNEDNLFLINNQQQQDLVDLDNKKDESQELKQLPTTIVQNDKTTTSGTGPTTATTTTTTLGKYVCPYCNLACSKPSVLQKHIRAHTNERPYPCDSCGFSFKTRSNLYKHCRSRTHANRVMGNNNKGGGGGIDVNNTSTTTNNLPTTISNSCSVSNNSVSSNLAININNELNGIDRDVQSKSPSLSTTVISTTPTTTKSNNDDLVQDLTKNKPYKPRFHTKHLYNVIKENIISQADQKEMGNSDTLLTGDNSQQHHKHSNLLSEHINDIINKNNSIVNNSSEMLFLKKKSTATSGNNDVLFDNNIINNNEYNNNSVRVQYHHHHLQRNDVFSPTQQLVQHHQHNNNNIDEPLNLTNKNRKRCLSEVMEPVAQKSLIKELLLKNLNSDMQCPHCKMIFQTVTELELHKLRSCKGFVKPGAKYSRSSSVNVASILTQNKNAFDNIPQMQNAVFPLKSPGPYLGKTQLVDIIDTTTSNKPRSFSFDDAAIPPGVFPLAQHHRNNLITSSSPILSSIDPNKEKRCNVKMFGGEVKITQTSGETKSYKIDHHNHHHHKEEQYDNCNLSPMEIAGGGKLLSENRVVKSGLQSGGTVLTNNKSNYHHGKNVDGLVQQTDVIRVYENTSVSPSIDLVGKTTKFNFELTNDERKSSESHQAIESTSNNNMMDASLTSYKYTNIMDFSQKAVKLLTPNLKQPNLAVPGVPAPTKFTFNAFATENNNHLKSPTIDLLPIITATTSTSSSSIASMKPMNLMVDGKVVRYVPGIPGPVATADALDRVYSSRNLPKKPSPLTITDNNTKSPTSSPVKLPSNIENNIKNIKLTLSELKSPKPPTLLLDKSPVKLSESKKFARPNSLALKPTTASLKQHHGLTPTMFNQILISPDTPRVAKKYMEHFLHGNYFSYLGLKCSTKSVYCTLNKTQPFYVPHFQKLSMYSEWRQQDTKTDKLYVSAYDSRQKHQKYTTAGRSQADLIVHSSYKFEEISNNNEEKNNDEQQQSRSTAILGGYECNEDYTYIRGRGRGRYVCDQCGIRCKKPSMLKKHIRTHSNDRPYTCNHCNFSFKTKGNLTKHMKSKAHTKNYTASGSSGSSTQQSGTQSSESDTDDSGMDSSDESSTRREEHEAAYGLLSLSQKNTQVIQEVNHGFVSTTTTTNLPSTQSESTATIMNTEEIAHVYNRNYAKNKTMDDKVLAINIITTTAKECPTATELTTASLISPMEDVHVGDESVRRKVHHFLGKSTINRPLTYPYTLVLPQNQEKSLNEQQQKPTNKLTQQVESVEEKFEPKCIKQFHVIQKYAPGLTINSKSNDNVESTSSKVIEKIQQKIVKKDEQPQRVMGQIPPPPILKVNDAIVMCNEQNVSLRKRSSDSNSNSGINTNNLTENCTKRPKNDEVMDLSMTSEKQNSESIRLNPNNNCVVNRSSPSIIVPSNKELINNFNKPNGINERQQQQQNDEARVVTFNFVPNESKKAQHVNNKFVCDNSAMETLADIATRQVKLEKNTIAKSVASEYLKIATKNEYKMGGGGDLIVGGRETNLFGGNNKEVNDLIVKPEGSKNCHICTKSFSKMSQLKLHMNIHYLERPFRCHSCSVSFRTKGHLQKHERSASHHNKLSSSPTLSSSEPRPFKCIDCSIAFRIHGHLAKHLRSKMHIMKLECLAKIPFGLYAELERSNSLLTEINTADGDQCLESLKTLAKKVFINDPNKLNQLNTVEHIETDNS